MKKTLLILFLTISTFVNAQDIIGEWETFDKNTGEKNSIVQIYKVGNSYFGKITDIFLNPKNSVCEPCTGDKKDQPIIGLVILENFKKDGDEYNKGTVVDPNTGDSYKCYLKLTSENKLKVRGFIGISLFGRTDYWMRKI